MSSAISLWECCPQLLLMTAISLIPHLPPCPTCAPPVGYFGYLLNTISELAGCPVGNGRVEGDLVQAVWALRGPTKRRASGSWGLDFLMWASCSFLRPCNVLASPTAVPPTPAASIMAASGPRARRMEAVRRKLQVWPPAVGHGRLFVRPPAVGGMAACVCGRQQ